MSSYSKKVLGVNSHLSWHPYISPPGSSHLPVIHPLPQNEPVADFRLSTTMSTHRPSQKCSGPGSCTPDLFRASPYEPLDESQSEIRLLEILDVSGKTVVCQLHTVSLSSAPIFTALSYVWGDPKVTERISLNGKSIAVSINLVPALRSVENHWQKEFPDRDRSTFRLWVDAACVNQKDDDERSSQVRRMYSIYSSAELVIAWLGTEKEILSLAFDTCEILAREFGKTAPSSDEPAGLADIQWLSAYPSLCQVDDPNMEVTLEFRRNRRWAAFDHLLNLSYWERVWIVQECALAEWLLLACRSRSMDYQTASEAVEAMYRFNSSPLYERPDFISSDVWSVFSEPAFHLYFILGTNAVRSMLRYLRSLSPKPPSNSLGMPLPVKADADTLRILARMVEHKKATNPKDYVYGMLGLSGLEVVPDCSASTPAYVAFVDYVKALLRVLLNERNASGDGDPICPLFFLNQAGMGIFDYPQGFPTWAPNYPMISVLSYLPDIVWGSSISASAADYPEVIGTCLYTHGVVTKPISHVWDFPNVAHALFDDGPLFPLLQGFVHRHSQAATGFPSLQAVARVLLMDLSPMSLGLFDRGLQIIKLRIKGFRRLPTVKERLQALADRLGQASEEAAVAWLVDHFWTDDEMTKNSVHRTALLEYVRQSFGSVGESDLDEQVRLTMEVGNFLRVFETESGHIGIGPKGCQPGDVVCLLFGSSAPVALRMIDHHYAHVGVCFVSSLMDGQAAWREMGQPTLESLKSTSTRLYYVFN